MAILWTIITLPAFTVQPYAMAGTLVRFSESPVADYATLLRFLYHGDGGSAKSSGF